MRQPRWTASSAGWRPRSLRPSTPGASRTSNRRLASPFGDVRMSTDRPTRRTERRIADSEPDHNAVLAYFRITSWAKSK